MTIGSLNLLSLILGIIAWFLPTLGIFTWKQQSKRQFFLSSIFSLAFCGLALWLQIYYNNYLIQMEDWGALADTSNIVRDISGILLFTTFILNSLNFYFSKKPRKLLE